MLHHEPRQIDDAIRTYINRCRELRLKLGKAQTPEEVEAIRRELDECRNAFEHHMETAVETND